MTEFETLLVALAAVYLALGVVWVRRDAFVFRSHTGRAFDAAPANALLGGDGGALQWLNPLPPFGLAYVVQPFPVSMGEEGVLAWTSAAQPPGDRPRQPNPRFLAWADVRRVEARDRDVFVEGELFVRTGSARLATHVARVLFDLARAKPTDRARRIDAELARAFDTVAIGHALGKAERESAPLLPPAIALFLLVFVATPFVDLARDIHHDWPWLVLALLALQAWSVITLWLVATRLDPRERWKHLLQCALSPLAAIRARDAFLRDAVATHSPLAVAKLLLPPAAFESLLTASLRDAAHPIPARCPNPDPRAHAVESSWRTNLRTAAARLAPSTAAAALTPPVRLAPDCLAYCPRCARQYTVPTSLCAGCGDHALSLFE